MRRTQGKRGWLDAGRRLVSPASRQARAEDGEEGPAAGMEGQVSTYRLLQGDAAEVLATLPAASVDAVVTDPPAGIFMMGARWDSDKGGRDQWVAWLAGIMAEARRVVKPGSWSLTWALPRTSHWTATALEDAGWRVVDCIYHHFATGWPKGQNQLKPATEVWWLAAAPGKRVLQIDACRIKGEKPSVPQPAFNSPTGAVYGFKAGTGRSGAMSDNTQGRWPANLVLSHAPTCRQVGTKRVKGSLITTPSAPTPASGYGGRLNGARGVRGIGDSDGTELVEEWVCDESCPVAELDRQSGVSKSSGGCAGGKLGGHVYGAYAYRGPRANSGGLGDTGGASRFFFIAKASTADRSRNSAVKNTHSTVKSTELMRYLTRLVCPPGGTVLDCFAGSFSTGVAAIEEGFNFIGIEQSEEYCAIGRARLGAMLLAQEEP